MPNWGKIGLTVCSAAMNFSSVILTVTDFVCAR